jgi:hypothetical protein
MDEIMATPPSLKSTPATPAPSLNLGENATNPRPAGPNTPVAIKDLMGEVWPLDSAMGRMLENTARENGVRPDYVSQQELDAYNAKPQRSTPIETVKTPDGKTVKVETDFNIVNKQPGTSPASSGESAFYQQGLTPVKQMQQALINLSRDIASHNIMDVADRTTSKGDLLTGSNPFLNFLVSSYMNVAKTTGKQLVNTDEKQPVRMDTAKLNDNFKGVLQTITRIGTPGAERAPDGNWGPRTNNALKQIYSLAYALTKVTEDMGVQLSSMYNEQDLLEFYNNIPQEPTQINVHEKVKRAAVLAKNLDKLRALYDSFRETIFNNPTYKAHISQEKPLFVKKHEQAIGPALNKYEQSLYQKHKATEIDISLNGRMTTIMPYNLSSMDAFKKFLNSKAQTVDITPEQLDAIKKGDKMILNTFLMEVADGLNKE